MNRSDLEDRVREVISGCKADVTDVNSIIAIVDAGPKVEEIMEAFDTYLEALATGSTVETWDAERVAEELGLLDANAARSTLSRSGIKKVRKAEDPDSGRTKAYYPAREVRALRVLRAIRKK